MYCPNCRTEYQEEVERCSDCGAALVEELPDLELPTFHGYTSILSTFNPADIAIIKSMLDGSDIDYFIHGENSGLIQPLAIPSVLMIRDEQADDVRELLKDLPLLYSIHLRESHTDPEK